MRVKFPPSRNVDSSNAFSPKHFASTDTPGRGPSFRQSIRRHIGWLAGAYLLLGTLQPAQAQTIVAQYPFTGSSGASTDNSPYSTAGDFAKNSAWTTSNTNIIISPGAGNPGPGWQVGSGDNGNGLTEATAVSTGAWFSFTVTPESGFSLSLSSFSFDAKQSGSNGAVAIHFFLRSSLDNYSTTLGSIGTDTAGVVLSTTAFNTYTIDLSDLAALQGITGPVTFRFYTADNRGDNAVGEYFDNVTLSATVTAVPEAGAVSLFLCTVGAMAGATRLRSSKS